MIQHPGFVKDLPVHHISTLSWKRLCLTYSAWDALANWVASVWAHHLQGSYGIRVLYHHGLALPYSLLRSLYHGSEADISQLYYGDTELHFCTFWMAQFHQCNLSSLGLHDP